MDIFYERQEGNMCRKHSLNAFFQCKKITTEDYKNWMKEFSKRRVYNFNSVANCKITISEIDYYNNLIQFVLVHYGVFSISFPYRRKAEEIKIIKEVKTHFIFEFTPGHVWGNLKKEDKWYKIDSLNGVSITNYNSILHSSNGIIIIAYDMLPILKLAKLDKFERSKDFPLGCLEIHSLRLVNFIISRYILTNHIPKSGLNFVYSFNQLIDRFDKYKKVDDSLYKKLNDIFKTMIKSI